MTSARDGTRNLIFVPRIGGRDRSSSAAVVVASSRVLMTGARDGTRNLIFVPRIGGRDPSSSAAVVVAGNLPPLTFPMLFERRLLESHGPLARLDGCD